MKAKYYSAIGSKKVKCELCPHMCVLTDGSTGVCRVRRNAGGTLETDTYNTYSAIGFDPIEKKPLYHFYPGKEILSLGSYGCNMRCEWCQNCSISQVGISNHRAQLYTPKELLDKANTRANNIGVAFTYNEPTIAFESTIEIAKLFQANELKNVLVTNGYLNPSPLKECLNYIDAVNLDIKTFNSVKHKKHTSANLENILSNAKAILKSGAHLELTMLVVPGISDNIDEFTRFIDWIRDELSIEVPLHISRYFPNNMFDLPATPTTVLDSFAAIANSVLNYVYLGNLHSAAYKNTYCPVCTNEIISRDGYRTTIVGADSHGNCTACDKKIFINV